jgi:hypothetical protein
MATEIAMLFFYLPIIIFDAMFPSPKHKAGKPTNGSGHQDVAR